MRLVTPAFVIVAASLASPTHAEVAVSEQRFDQQEESQNLRGLKKSKKPSHVIPTNEMTKPQGLMVTPNSLSEVAQQAASTGEMSRTMDTLDGPTKSKSPTSTKGYATNGSVNEAGSTSESASSIAYSASSSGNTVAESSTGYAEDPSSSASGTSASSSGYATYGNTDPSSGTVTSSSGYMPGSVGTASGTMASVASSSSGYATDASTDPVSGTVPSQSSSSGFLQNFSGSAYAGAASTQNASVRSVGTDASREGTLTTTDSSVQRVGTEVSTGVGLSVPKTVRAYPTNNVIINDKTSKLMAKTKFDTTETALTDDSSTSSASSSKLKHGTFKTEEESVDCKVQTATQDKRIEYPTWIASYPGSGSKLTWQLVEATTGIVTGDDLDTFGRVKNKTACAVKTHFPSHAQTDVFLKLSPQIERAILLIRNPMHAIPSFFRFTYYLDHKQSTNSKKKKNSPPAKAWVAWRNDFFEQEMNLWVQNTEYWLKQYRRENLHLLPFEYLISLDRGSDELQKVGNFLGSGDQTIASSLVPPEQFCCLWGKIVQHSEKTSSAKKDIFTSKQLQRILDELTRLMQSNDSFPEFSQLMQEYITEVNNMAAEISGKNGEKTGALS